MTSSALQLVLFTSLSLSAATSSALQLVLFTSPAIVCSDQQCLTIGTVYIPCHCLQWPAVPYNWYCLHPLPLSAVTSSTLQLLLFTSPAIVCSDQQCLTIGTVYIPAIVCSDQQCLTIGSVYIPVIVCSDQQCLTIGTVYIPCHCLQWPAVPYNWFCLHPLPLSAVTSSALQLVLFTSLSLSAVTSSALQLVLFTSPAIVCSDQQCLTIGSVYIPAIVCSDQQCLTIGSVYIPVIVCSDQQCLTIATVYIPCHCLQWPAVPYNWYCLHPLPLSAATSSALQLVLFTSPAIVCSNQQCLTIGTVYIPCHCLQQPAVPYNWYCLHPLSLSAATSSALQLVLFTSLSLSAVTSSALQLVLFTSLSSSAATSSALQLLLFTSPAFVCSDQQCLTITTVYIPCQSIMKDLPNNPSHHEQMLLPQSNISLLAKMATQYYELMCWWFSQCTVWYNSVCVNSVYLQTAAKFVLRRTRTDLNTLHRDVANSR